MQRHTAAEADFDRLPKCLPLDGDVEDSWYVVRAKEGQRSVYLDARTGRKQVNSQRIALSERGDLPALFADRSPTASCSNRSGEICIRLTDRLSEDFHAISSRVVL